MKFTRSSLIPLSIFVVVFLTHLSSGNTATYDSALSIQTAASIVREGNTDLDEYQPLVSTTWLSTETIDGHIYMLYPIGPSIMAVPFVFVLDRLSPDFNASLQHGFAENLQTFIACLIVALTTVFIYWIARRYLNRRYSVFAAFVFAFCTTAWSTASRTLWQHGPSMLMLSIALYLILRAKDNPGLVQFISLPLAFAYVIRPTNSISIAVLTLYVFIYFRKYIVKYILWSLPIAIPFMLLNLSVYHFILPNYYRWYTGFTTTTFFQALIGHWLSPSRGLLIFSPVLIFSIVGAALKLRRKPIEHLDLFVIAIIALHWIAISLWWNWWGGVSFGPRLFTDVLPYFIYLLIPSVALLSQSISARKIALASGFAALTGFSFFVHARGANVPVVIDWNGVPAAIDVYPDRVWDWRDIQFLRGIYWGPPIDLAVSGVPSDHLFDPELFARLGSNQIRARDFDVGHALIAPLGRTWLAIVVGQSITNEFLPLFDAVTVVGHGQTIADRQSYNLYYFDLGQRIQQAASQSSSTAFWSPQIYPDSSAANTATLPINFDETAQLIGFNLAKVSGPSQGLTLITFWQAGDHIVTPLQMFVHAIGPDGSIVAQEDRLDASAFGWHSGDLIAQINHLALPDRSGAVWIEIGLYNQASGDRLPVMVDSREVDHRLLLAQIPNP